MSHPFKINYNKYTSFQYLIVYSLFLLALKIALMPFVHAIDADGISRVYLSLQLAENFHIVHSGNWPPLYFYLMGAALKIYHNPTYTPLIVNILLSVMMLFPLYFLMKRFFNAHIALILCLLFSLSPIVFRLSLLSLSEIPYVFFIILGASVLAKGLIEKHNAYILLAGFLFSIAGGFRYESWILAPLAAIIIAIEFSFRQAILFIISAMLFPIYWLSSNYIYSGNAIDSFTWAIEATQSNKIDSLDSFLRRTWWYPLSLMLAFGPIAFYFFIKEIVRVCKNRKLNRLPFLFFAMFIAFYLIWAVNCYRGSLLMQHRFSITLFLLCFPFLGYYFKNKALHKFKTAMLFSLSAFFLAFVYSSKGARPIPRLLNNSAFNIAETVKNNTLPNSGYITDFWNWETTHYIAFASELPQQNMVIIDSNTNQETFIENIESVLEKHYQGCILISNKGRLINEVSIHGDTTLSFNKIDKHLKINLLINDNGIRVYKYFTIYARDSDGMITEL